jgi:hypothetical protein
MKTIPTKPQGSRLKMVWITLLLGATALVAACGGGGGGDFAAVGSGGTGAVAQGPISGFGSVIVNGVRFDDNGATVTIDDNGGLSNQLKLGMMVEIEGTSGSTATTGTATSITAFSHVQGPISAPPVTTSDPKVGTLTVLGITVSINASTIFENVSGIAALAQNDVIEVYGLVNGADGLTATRIEKKTTTEVRTVGTVQALDTVAKTFTLHNITVNYTSAQLDNLSAGLANGTVVRVKGTLSNSTTIAATRVKAVNLTPVVKEGQKVEIEGLVANFVSIANFEVQGLKVDASKVSPAVSVSNGVRVEVEGTVTNGVLVATKVELKNEGVEAEVELFGTVAGLNATAQTFTLRSGTVTVHWSGTTIFESPLTAGTLDGKSVEVKGNVVNGIVEATRIKINS